MKGGPRRRASPDRRRAAAPIMRRLFPGVPGGPSRDERDDLEHRVELARAGQCATPFGIRAMQELETLNPSKGPRRTLRSCFWRSTRLGWRSSRPGSSRSARPRAPRTRQGSSSQHGSPPAVATIVAILAATLPVEAARGFAFALELSNFELRTLCGKFKFEVQVRPRRRSRPPALRPMDRRPVPRGGGVALGFELAISSRPSRGTRSSARCCRSGRFRS
jgi:hypothetical protein